MLIAWGIALLGVGGWALAQRRLEAAVDALPEAERTALTARTRPAEIAAAAVVLGGIALFFGMGRGTNAMVAAVVLFVVNAGLLAGARWWLSSGLAAPTAYRTAAIVHAVTSALAFGGVAAALVANRVQP